MTRPKPQSAPRHLPRGALHTQTMISCVGRQGLEKNADAVFPSPTLTAGGAAWYHESMKRTWIFYTVTVVWFVAIIALGVSARAVKDEWTAFVLSGVTFILFLLCIAAVIVVVSASTASYKKDVARLDAALRTRTYDEATEYFARAVRTRVLPFTARNACVCLFTLGLAAENNDVMRTASEAYPWYVGNVRSLYFRILLALRDRETDRARMMYAELEKTGGAAFDVQRRLCERIFRAVDTGDPTDRFYEDSDFPVVRKIYDMYTSGADDAA